ncbi:hypothetical protein ACLK1T_05490 [Escherichia coli]
MACDGGGSNVRRSLNVPFEGKTAPNQWIVVDIADESTRRAVSVLLRSGAPVCLCRAAARGAPFQFMVIEGNRSAA